MFTRLSKVLAGVLVVVSVLEYVVPDTTDYIALVPGRTLPCLWNLVTCSLLHTNPFELLLSVAALLGLARLVEPVYGSKEFLRFIFTVAVLISCTVFVVVYVTFAITASGYVLYHPFMGFHGIVAALLVAVKQIMPLHELKLFGNLQLRVQYLPSVVLVLVVSIAFILKRTDYLAFYLTGTYMGWLYLRFWQQQPDSPFYGDASDEFKFSSFFPELIAPAIDAVAWALGVVTRLRHAPGDREPVIRSLAGPSVLGTDNADANRRRERGAKALEERLGLKSGVVAVPTNKDAILGQPGSSDVETPDANRMAATS